MRSHSLASLGNASKVRIGTHTWSILKIRHVYMVMSEGAGHYYSQTAQSSAKPAISYYHQIVLIRVFTLESINMMNVWILTWYASIQVKQQL